MILKDLDIIKSEIDRAIKDLDLDLNGLTILTEAASGLFAFTPVIALLAGAEKVFAISQSSEYGSFDEIREITQDICKRIGIGVSGLEILPKDQFHGYNNIDIVTNSGHVRPVNDKLISKLKKDAVISYMSEPWEHRTSDLDLESCVRNGIPLYGTNEDHPHVNCFIETGHLALQMIYESKISVVNAGIAIVSRDKFGKTIYDQLKQYTSRIRVIDNFASISADDLKDLDILIVADWLYDKQIISKNGIINPADLKKYSPDVKIIQFCGNNNLNDIREQEISIYPDKELAPSRMFYTLADISYRATIRLFAAGLSVGEGLIKSGKKGLTGVERKTFMESNYPALAFEDPRCW